MAIGTPSKISGLNEVLTNLNREIVKIRGRNRKGMEAVGLKVRGWAEPRTPKKTGNLRGSYHHRSWDDLRGVGVSIWLTADYAPHVHEINKNYTQGEWKFLENPIKEHHQEILNTIVDWSWR